VVKDSILLPESRVGAGAVVLRTILNERSSIEPHAAVGSDDKITVVATNSTMEV
jgi:ADP-glucose pyrophosphorylase